MPSDPGLLAAGSSTFSAVLKRVLGFSRAAALDGGAGRRGAVERAAPAAGKELEAASPAFDALTLFVRTLDLETQDKLRTLMHAGREAMALPAAAAAVAALRTSGAAPAEFRVCGPTELHELQRGHALACATCFDLELELGLWAQSGTPESLDERVWLRFGRELASSRMDEWACFAVVDARDRLQKLYLRRGKTRWWSFAALIDRPSERALGVPRAARSGRAGLIVLPVKAALGRSCSANLRAVRRASRAVSARLGQWAPASRGAEAKAAPKATS